jgi:heme/copper-type cytochrome/quinol oxidase subunit 2
MLQGIYDFIKDIFAPLGDYLIGSFVPVASTYADDIDSLIALIAVMVGFWALLAYAAFFFLIFRFREKDGQRAKYVTGEEKDLKRWITYPHAAIIVCDLAWFGTTSSSVCPKRTARFASFRSNGPGTSFTPVPTTSSIPMTTSPRSTSSTSKRG